MSEDLIRLSELVPEHARYHGMELQSAAHDLREIIELLADYYFQSGGGELPERVCWVGRASSSSRSAKRYMIDFESLLSYFGRWDSTGAPFECYSKTEQKYSEIPAGCVYFSKALMADWAAGAGLDSFRYMVEVEDENLDVSEGVRGKELRKIESLTQGLARLIVEVDRAHADPVQNREVRTEQEVMDALRRAEIIKRRASDLRTPRRSNSNLYADLMRLAEAAGVELPKSHVTIRKYMEGD